MNQVQVDMKQIEAFLIQEAACLDQKQFKEWINLYTDDAIYWVPSNLDDYDPNMHVSIIYDDMPRLKERIWRLESGLAYGQEPASKTVHIISNYRMLDNNEKEIKVASNFIFVELRRSIQTIYSGVFEHTLRYEGNQWKIAAKKIILTENDEFIGNFSFLI